MLFQYQIDHQTNEINDPGEADIRRVISELGNRDSAVLFRDDFTYMQVSVDGDALLLEHQNGSIEQFFEAPPETTREQTIQAFVSYRLDDSWENDLQWAHISPEDFNLEFTILTSLPESALDGMVELTFDGHLEMPFIGIYHWLTLYEQLLGGDPEELEEEFELIGEAEAETGAHLYMYPVPAPLTVGLENLSTEEVSALAQKWLMSDEFPNDEVQLEEATTLIHEIRQMAKEAASQSEILLICELVYGEE